MPRILEEIQLPSLIQNDIQPPKEGIALFYSDGSLILMHPDRTTEMVATGNLDDIEINVNLENYYTIKQVDDLINTKIDELEQMGFGVEKVSELPAEGEANKIYLLPNESGNYDEYLYYSGSWEKIGSTDIDLTDYAKKSDIPNAYTKSEVDELLNRAPGKAIFRDWEEL